MVEAQVSAGGERGARLRLVCFRLRDQEFALPIAAVRETIRMRPITPVFLTPAWVVGIFSLRGEIVTAIDLAQWLGMPHTSIGEDSRLVVIAHESRVIGFVADALCELRTLEASAIGPVPKTLSQEQLALLSGVSATSTGAVRVLEPSALFQSDRLRELGEGRRGEGGLELLATST